MVRGMPPLEAFVPSVAIGLILVVMLWFALGTQRNIRRGNDLLRWLRGGLPILGRRTTMRWLGSSAVELGIVKGEPPFRDATVVVVLEPRDVAVLWAFARSRGRRDFVIIRANLVRAPGFSMDIRDPSGWTGRPDEADGEWQNSGAGTVTLVGPGADEALVRAAWDRLSKLTAGVWRLTVQQVVPHIEVHFRPPSGTAGSERVVGPIRDLARKLSGS
jgi:hypothetical protein